MLLSPISVSPVEEGFGALAGGLIETFWGLCGPSFLGSVSLFPNANNLFSDAEAGEDC